MLTVHTYYTQKYCDDGSEDEASIFESITHGIYAGADVSFEKMHYRLQVSEDEIG